MRPEIPRDDPRRPEHPARGLSPGNRPIEPDDYPPTRCPGPLEPPGPTPLFAGRYEIVRELGRGGMGVVSLARDTRLPRDVAIKVPRHHLEPDSLRRFFREAQAAAKLDHPNICRILDLGEADGLPFIVLAFVRGRTLAEVVEHRPVEPTQAAKVARSVARTIQFAHDRGIVHRDLKPANLMIGDRRELVVMDFGLARLEDEERRTQTGQVFGTPAYMSPEQVQGRAEDMGKSCDIYTLGVILYQLLAGRLPFRGPGWDLPRQIIQVEPEPPSTVVRGIDSEMDAIVGRAMAKEIRDRYRSMEEFAGALADYLRRRGSLSDSGMKFGPSTPPTGPSAAVPVPLAEPAHRADALPVRLREEPLRERGRHRFGVWDGLAWGAIALLAVAGVDILLAAGRGPAPAPSAAPPVAKARPPAPTRPVSARSERIGRAIDGLEFVDEGIVTGVPDRLPSPKRRDRDSR